MALVPVSFCDGSLRTLRSSEYSTADEVMGKVLGLLDLAGYKDDFRLAYTTETTLAILKPSDNIVGILKDSAIQYPPRDDDPKIILLRTFDMDPEADGLPEKLDELMFYQAIHFWRRGWLRFRCDQDITIAAMLYKYRQHYTKGSALPSVEILQQILGEWLPKALKESHSVYEQVAGCLRALPESIGYQSLPIPDYARGAMVFPATLLRNGRGNKVRIETLIYIKHNRVTIMGLDGVLRSQFELAAIRHFREEPPDFVLEVAEGKDECLFLLFTAPNSSSIISTMVEYTARKLRGAEVSGAKKM